MQPKGFKDYYYILGVNKTALPAQIETAYHELNERYGPHISITGQDPDMMLQRYNDICQAYEVLMDPARRKEYDKNNDPHLHKSDLRALWAKYSGADAQKDAVQKAVIADTVLEISITLRQAIKGCNKTVQIEEPNPCKDCAGLKPVLRLQCPNCRGLGYTSSTRTEELTIPAGLMDKAELRYEDLGKYDLQSGSHAALVVQIQLEPHQFFSVLDRDITCTIPITIYESVLGAEIEVPTATGKVIMRVQPMTQPGRVYRLKGLGLAGADQLVTVDVTTPQQLSHEGVELFRKLQQLSKDPNPRAAIISNL